MTKFFTPPPPYTDDHSIDDIVDFMRYLVHKRLLSHFGVKNWHQFMVDATVVSNTDTGKKELHSKFYSKPLKNSSWQYWDNDNEDFFMPLMHAVLVIRKKMLEAGEIECNNLRIILDKANYQTQHDGHDALPLRATYVNCPYQLTDINPSDTKNVQNLCADFTQYPKTPAEIAEEKLGCSEHGKFISIKNPYFDNLIENSLEGNTTYKNAMQQLAEALVQTVHTRKQPWNTLLIEFELESGKAKNIHFQRVCNGIGYAYQPNNANAIIEQLIKVRGCIQPNVLLNDYGRFLLNSSGDFQHF